MDQSKKHALNNKAVKKRERIPAPPGPEASWEEQAAYYDKYDFFEIADAGHSIPVKEKKFLSDMARTATAQKKREQVNISLDPEQVLQLKQIAKRKHLSTSTLARAWLLDRLLDETSK